MKRAYFPLSLYVILVLLVTPMLALAAHQSGHPMRVVGGAVVAGLIAGFLAKLIARRLG